MQWDLFDALDLALLTLAYWCLDRCVRVDGFARMIRHLAREQGSAVLHQIAWTAVCLCTSLIWSWESTPQADSVRLLCIGLTAMLTWKAATKDIDAAFDKPEWAARMAICLSVIGTWWSPAFVLLSAYLLTHPFRLWEHHSTFPMRALLACSAFLCTASLASLIGGLSIYQDSISLFFLVINIQVSHYLITAFAKAWLGPKWYSWAIDNQTHHLAATAYSWGWAKFLPWKVWRTVIELIRRTEVPMQCVAFAVEVLAPFALLSPRIAIAFSLLWAGFHVGVFLVAGLLFWDWIAANLFIAASIALLPEQVTTQLFGWPAVLVCLLYLFVFPLRHKLWKPMPLGWWDTPLTQRMHWIAVGESGKLYGIYNNWMCPNERLFGKLHGCFMAPVSGITYHLGEVWKRDLRDAIRSAGPSLDRINLLRTRYGVLARDEEMQRNHVAYLKRYFARLNNGARKRVLPKFLRWMKAPGDQIFYWGDLPSYQGQEAVRNIRIVYREEYYDGSRLVRLMDEQIVEFEIRDEDQDLQCSPEPSPKQIDELLLPQAVGKIIDLPSFADGFVKSDDGKTPIAEVK